MVTTDYCYPDLQWKRVSGTEQNTTWRGKESVAVKGKPFRRPAAVHRNMTGMFSSKIPPD